MRRNGIIPYKENTPACAVAWVLFEVNCCLGLPYKLQSRQAFDFNSIFFTFHPYSFSASMHRRDDVRPPLSKCRQVATTGQLCGGLSGMCGVPAFGYTKKYFSASRNWCKVPRYCVSMFLSLTLTACIKVANIKGSLTGCAQMVEQARAFCSHFAKTERPFFISTSINSNVGSWNVESYSIEPSIKLTSEPSVS